MSKIEKLIASIRNNPKAVRFVDLDKIMTRHGFIPRQRGTSHVVYRKSGKRAEVVKPHGGETFVKPVYVRSCLEAIEGEVLDASQED